MYKRQAWSNLIKAMQYLEFKKGDKTDLEKVIALADEINNSLDSYLDAGKDAFTTALAEAKDVYADGNAMQDDVDAVSYTHLDVYKRQGTDFHLKQRRALRES